MDELQELVDSLSPVVSALRKLGVRHYVGGSVASSFHGAIRSTMDVDLVCELAEGDVSHFIASIGADYYASETAMRDAVQRRACFNLIHLPTSFKVDVFISRGRPFDLDSMQRATMQRLGGARFVELPIATAEDSIISKLEWYRLTNETSERQWDDVSRLLDLLGDEADRDYLYRSALSVGVTDLLDRLMAGR
ncbi:MAG: hypothetical protein ACYC3X_05020 [Pirellulaceae bacterium]